MAVEFFASDDVTPVTALVFPNVQAGADSDTLAIHLWNEKGNPGGQEVQNTILITQTEDPLVANTFRSSGLPPQDELWNRARIVGFDNSGDSTWSVDNTDWLPLGASSGFPIGRIPPDCAVYLERRLHPPSTAAGLLTWRFLDAVLKDEYARALPIPLTLLERGILPLTGDRATGVILRGGAVTPTGTPDDEIHVAAALWQFAGRAYGKIATDTTLNQNDSAAAALVATESYYATISLNASGVVATKSVKAVSPVKPSVPAGNAFLAWVLVAFGGGGSVIDAADITGTPAYGRYLVTAGSGLSVVVHRGQSIAGASYRVHTGSTTISGLTNTSDNFIWEVSTGLFTVTTTEVAPDATALLIAKVTCAGGVVTAIADRRLYAGRSVVLTLKGATGAVSSQLDFAMFEHPEGDLEEVAFHISNASGSAGVTKVDVKRSTAGGAAATIFTSFATEDLRPSIAFDATVLQHRTAIPEVVRAVRGDVFSVTIVAVPTTTSPDFCEVALTFRVP